MSFYLFIILFLTKNVSTNYFFEIENCQITSHGSEYIGKINKTENGKSCLNWKKEYIDQLHLDKIYYFDLSSIIGINYCRNPTHFPNGPWCFIDNETLEWEYCNIPSCTKERNWCKDSEKGVEYIGNIDYTENGNTCKPWINQKRFSAKTFREKSLIYAGNKCRNPDNSQKPWCYYTDNYNWEYCNVPKCDDEFSQIEYFGGYDFLKTIPKNTNIIALNEIYHNMTVIISINIELWNSDVSKKTSLWATDYDPKCQTDLNEYEYCQMYTLTSSEEIYILTYYCIQPLKYLIFISPLTNRDVKIIHSGTIYKFSRKSSEEFLDYQEKIQKYLDRKEIENVVIPNTENHGFFFLINNNVIPYAVTPNNKVVITISSVGNGCVAFLPSENYIDSKFYLSFKDFFQIVYNKGNVIPKKLTKKLLKELELNKLSGEDLSTPVIWNAHDPIGQNESEILLDLIKAGLRIIIGVKPWAYNHYRTKLLTSELKILFLASGIWPSTETLNENVLLVKEVKIITFPLVHLLNYAATSISNAITVSSKIKHILLKVPFQQLIHENIFGNVKENIHSLYTNYLPMYKHLIPCLNKPLTNKNDKIIIGLLNDILLSPFGNTFTAPGLSFYPGDFQTNDIRLLTVKMKLNLKFNNEIHQLGLYALPGKEFSVKITKSISKQCNIHINSHLFKVTNKDEWKKWPVTSIVYYINPNKTETFSFPFGGLISILCKENNDKIDIVFSGVVQIPYFDRRNDQSLEIWLKINNQVSPWAILASDTLVFVVSSNTIRNLADPNKILSMYDSMVKEQFHLKGRFISSSRREIISTDIQIKAGYMHAGYPIGTMIYYVTNPGVIADFVFSKSNIETDGEWGLLHEIGHNLQDDIFNFEGTGEVTNNIFTLVGIESMTKQNSWSSTNGWLNTRYNVTNMINYINNGTFSEWCKIPYLGLGIYAQLRNSFEWEFYSQLFRRYNDLTKNNTSLVDEEKVNLWIVETSTVAKMNLCPLYDLWRWPFDENLVGELSKFPLFLPDDFLTKMVENRVTEIINKYGGSSLVKRIPNKIREIFGPVKNKLTIEGSRVIEEIKIMDYVY